MCSHPQRYCLPSTFTPPPSVEHKQGEERGGEVERMREGDREREEGREEGSGGGERGAWGGRSGGTGGLGCVLSPLSVCECTDGSLVI